MATPANYPMFVSIEGLYGTSAGLIQFSYGDLNEEQWEIAHELDGLDRHRYIQAVLDNDTEEIAQILGEDY